MNEAAEYIGKLIKRAKVAQKEAEGFSQEKVDKLITAICWEIVREETSDKIAKMAVEESKMGNYQGKYAKLQKKTRGALRDMKGAKSLGIIETDEERGLIKIAKPVGVIGALLPCTNPEATPVIKAMNAIKGRNAIIMAPHPRTKKTNTYIINIMRDVLKKYGVPEDLLIAIEEPTLEISNELMKQCDLVMATGGAGMVKAAYSSGTPAYGVGAGNAVVVVDETADIADAANKIKLGKTFDFATSCSSENSIIVVESVYDRLIEQLQAEGGYLTNAEEKEKLKNTMWINGVLNRAIVAQPIEKIAKEAGIEVPEGKEFIMVEEEGIGKEHPFSGEKMCMVLTVFKAGDFNEAVEKLNEITGYQGTGHSCGIHTTNEDRVIEMGLRTKTSRVMVRQAQCYGNSGNWDNGMPFTLTLSCGTWGGNIASENITWKHFINVTWISKPIEMAIPDDNILFEELK